MKKNNFITAIMFFCVLLLHSNCSNHMEVKSPGQQLVEKIKSRLTNKDFVKSSAHQNPYNQISSDIEKFRKFVTFRPDYKAVNSHFLNISTPTKLGMQNPHDVELVKSSLLEYYTQTGETFNETDFYTTNDRLNRYTNDDTGVNSLLEDALAEKSISQTQNDVLRMLLSKIASAKSLTEADNINKTIEYEVIQSGINENDRALILTTNSIFNENLQNQIARDRNGVSSFRKTAAVAVIILVTVIKVAVAAVVGAITGSVICCLIQDDCSWNCIGPRVRNSVLTTVGRAAYGLLFL